MDEAPAYFRWMVSRISPFLGKNVLDLGSGYGTHLTQILPRVEKITALDSSPEAAKCLAERFKTFSQFRAVCTDFSQQPLPGWMRISKFDTVLSLNLLEHLPDDIKALRCMNSLLPASQGVLILQVPAHPGLYGSLDKQARHVRRYRKAELAVKLEQTGFKVLHIEFFNRLGAIFWGLNARLLHNRRYSKFFDFQIRLFDRLLVPVLKPLEYLVPLPFGLSILAVAVKQREA